MRRIRSAIAVLVAALGVAGCGTPIFTTVKNGEGRKVQQLVPDRTGWLAMRRPRPDQPLERDMDALSMTVHPGSGELYLADANLDRILKLSPTGTLTDWAGHEAGPRETRVPGHRRDAVVDAAGNLYLTEGKRGVVVRVAPDGTTTVIAGGGTSDAPAGPATELALSQPEGLAIAPNGDLLLVESGDDKVWRLSPTPAGVFTAELALRNPTEEEPDGVMLESPSDVAVGEDGTLYVADRAGSTGRLLRQSRGGPLEELARVVGIPSRLTVDAAGNLYYVAAGQSGVRKVTPRGEISLLAGATLPPIKNEEGTAVAVPEPQALLLGPDDRLTIGYNTRQVRQLSLASPEAGSDVAGYPVAGATPGRAPFPGTGIGGLVFVNGKLLVAEEQGDLLEVADGAATRVREGVLRLDAGPREKANFHEPAGLVFRPDGTLIVSDAMHRRLRAIAPDGTTTVFAGTDQRGMRDGPLASATFSGPGELAIDRNGTIYLEDDYDVRAITPDGQVKTLFNNDGTILDLAVGPDGKIYVVTENHEKEESERRLRAYSAAGDEVAVPGADRLKHPRSVGVDPQGRVIVADNRFTDGSRGTTVVALQPDGAEQVLVATRDHDRSGQVLGEYSVFLTPAPPPILHAGDLTVGPDGTVYFIHHTGVFAVKNYGAKAWWWPFR